MVPPLRQSDASPRRLLRPFLAAASLACAAAAWQPSAVAADGIAASGVAMVPQDAAFLSASLRLREQFDRIVKSNAFAAIAKLPSVKRALESIEEQAGQPGSPLSMVATFMELPENQQARELLEDMVSSDTFLYGDPSCITFVELLKKVQRAQQTANILLMARGDSSLGDRIPDQIRLEVEDEEEEEDEDEAEDDEDEDDEGAALPDRVPFRQVRFQVADAVEEIPADELAGRLVLKTLAENVDSIVVPDLVWGFKTTKLDAGASQLKRIEVLVKLFTQANPDLADSLQRTKIAGGEVVSFTVKGSMLPWEQLTRDAAEDLDQEQLDNVLDRLRSLQIVVALGIIGDRVILSIGDSVEHLGKLAVAGAGNGLLATKPFQPLVAHGDKPITAVSYVSEAMARAVAASAEDIEHLADLSDTIADMADLPEGAAEEARQDLDRVAKGYGRRLPVPGPWMAYSFLSELGYEGYVWDWSKNVPLDGSKRLELLEHAGGAPLGALVFRLKSDPEQFEDFVSWGEMAWSFFRKYLLPKADEDDQETFEEIDEHIAPLGPRLVGILREKILPALDGGQIGFVLDSKSRSKRLQKTLPASAEPLPLVEPAIVVGLDDPKLFREGMSDLFALADELVDEIREVNPDAVPADYQVPEPEKSKVEGGAVWSFAMPGSGIDEQVRPAIGVGEDVAVLSLVPKQAGRLLVESRLETGSQLSSFEEPLAGAAALDFAGLVDAIQPWVVYLARYGSVQQREGDVDSDRELGPGDENEQVKDVLAQSGVVFDAIKSLRAAVAETSTSADATVTHWRNVIRDTPAPK
jgi:hypothetical protein